MNRHYTAGEYRALIESLAVRVPGIALGADVMVGFPGEGDNEYQNTVRLIEDLPLSHLHVFSYSPRPGTPASMMGKQVPERVKQERNAILRQIGMKKNREFRSRFLGKVMSVVVESESSREGGVRTGLTDNYIRVTINDVEKGNTGREIVVLINEVHNNGTIGRILR
jgi:threonylcarbamoyladenosine tRNA methylthiotransferase MtaB